MQVSVPQSGFTLVELVVTIILIGILSAVVGPKFFSRGSYETMVDITLTEQTIKFAQKHAIQTGCRTQVKISTNGISIVKTPPTELTDCAEDFNSICSAHDDVSSLSADCHYLKSFDNAAINQRYIYAFKSAPVIKTDSSGTSSTVSGIFSMQFDPKGRPERTTGGLYQNDLTIQLISNNLSKSITVTRNTGFTYAN